MHSWSKRGRAIHYTGSMEVERYVYTPGIHGLELAKALMEGRILGMKCGDTVLVPPKTYCPDGSEGSLVEVTGEWVVETYTVVYRGLEGEDLGEPRIVAVVRPEGGLGGIIHYVRADPGRVSIGMRVRPVFKPREQRRGLITDIEYFEPSQP